MSSLLLISSVEELQNKVNLAVSSFGDIPGIYVSLNKTQVAVEKILLRNGIDINKLFFIDCVSTENIEEDSLHISPNSLKTLNEVIKDFIQEIPGKKFLIIDALSTLLIYNSENKVANFIKEVVETASKNNTDIVALSPSTKGEDLLDKIFNFFDEVKKNKNMKKEVSGENEEDLIY